MKPDVGFLIFVFLTLFLVSSCSAKTESPTPSEITIGVIAPLTGPVARFGQYMREGIDLAVEEINTAGGVNGRPIKLVYEDTKCIDLAATQTALRKLKEIDNAAAILGPYCGSTNILAGTFSTENKIVIVAPGDNFGKTGAYKINTRYLIHKEARLLGTYALARGWTKVAVLYYDNDWGQAYRDTIKKTLEAKGGNVTLAQGYTFDNLDVRTQLLKIKESEPDALVILDSTSGELFQQVVEVGLKVPLLSEWEIEKPETKGVAGPALEGVTYFLPVEQKTEFHTAFQERYGKEPNIVTIDSYDAANILALALTSCPEASPDCLIDKLTSIKNHSGAGGTMTFDKETWSFDRPFTLKTAKNGKLVEGEQPEWISTFK